MTIYEIAERLNGCANGTACKTCKHKPQFDCQAYIISEMGEACRQIVEQEDDGK